jgi:ribosomal silencing factor RsfS
MQKRKKDVDSTKLCDAIVEGMQENKAKDIVVLDLREISNAVCDYFVICSGESSTQVDGISSSVTRFTRKELKEIKLKEDHRNYNQTIKFLIHTAEKGNLQVANKNISSGVCKTPVGNISEVNSPLGESSELCQPGSKAPKSTPYKKEVDYWG